MDEKWHTRRSFAKSAVAGLAALPLAGTAFGQTRARRPAATQPAPGETDLSAYAYASKIWVRVGAAPFTCYRADAAQKYPYLYPVLGPATGLPLTDEAGRQYPHHRSLFLGCDRVNGGNYWQEGLERGQIVSSGPKLETESKQRIVITDACQWRQPASAAIIDDRRKWTITAPESGLRLIDAEIVLTARVDVHIEKTNHSLFSMRADLSMTPLQGGKLMDSDGRSGEKGTFGQEAAWCGYTAARLGRPESIVLMDHPRNPWSPCKWFTRDYGFISPTPFYWFEKGWDLPAGKSISLRYRVAALAGGLDERRLADIYGDFAS